MNTRASRVLLAVAQLASILLIGCGVKQIKSTVPAFAQAAELTSRINTAAAIISDVAKVLAVAAKVIPSA